MDRQHLKRLLLLLGIPALLIIATVIYQRHQPSPQVLEQRWRVTAITVKPGTHAPNIILFGRVESPQTATLTSALSADVEQVLVREGNEVPKGKLLVQLEDRPLQLQHQEQLAAIAEFKAKIAAEKNRYATDQKALKHEQALVELKKKAVARLANLYSKKVASEDVLEKSKQELEQQQLALRQRELAINDHQHRLDQLQAQLTKSESLAEQVAIDIKRTQVRAPFPARISERLVSPGDRVQPGTPLLKLFNHTDLEVRAQVPNNNVATLRQALAKKEKLLGQTTLSYQTVQLALVRLSANISAGRGGVDAFLRVTNGDWLPLDQTLKLQLTLPELSEVYRIPQAALYTGDRIYQISENRLQTVPVTVVGQQQEGSNVWLLIRSEKLTAGAQILAVQLPQARQGLLVDVVHD